MEFDRRKYLKYRYQQAQCKKIQRLYKQGLQKEDCAICGNVLTEAHHENYEEPYVIIWLCLKCHGQTTRKYQTNSTNWTPTNSTKWTPTNKMRGKVYK